MSNSINRLVPNAEAELALLWELYKCGGDGDTGYIVERAMARFPVLQTPTQLDRETPSGTIWWRGRFRLDLSRLGRKDEAQNYRRGSWRIIQKGRERLKRVGYGVEKKWIRNHVGEDNQVTPEDKDAQLIASIFEMFEQLSPDKQEFMINVFKGLKPKKGAA